MTFSIYRHEIGNIFEKQGMQIKPTLNEHT